MTIAAAPTLLLAVGGMTLILSHWVQTSRWFEGIWFATMAGTAALLATHEFLPGISETAVEAPRILWSTDPLAIAGQTLALMFGILIGSGAVGIRSRHDRTAERYGFLCFLIAGVMLVISANDLILVALATEIVQFASWALRKCERLETASSQVGDLDSPIAEQTGQAPLDLGSSRTPLFGNNRAETRNDIALWLGIASSCCLWLGIGLLGNLAAGTHFDELRRVLTDAYVPGAGHAVIGSGSRLGLLAMGLIVAGLGGRIGLVPWQLGFIEHGRNVSYWTAGCILVGGQLCGILALARLCGTVWVGYRDELLLLLLVLAILTCVVSAALAGMGLVNGEGRLRRWVISLSMLQAAWLTVGVMSATADLAAAEHSLTAAAGQPGALGLLIFAIAASQAAQVALFLLFSHLMRNGRDVEFIEELLGLGRLRPIPAGALMIALASLIGQPPLWGFWANWLMMLAGLNIRATGVRDNATPHAGLIVLLIVATAATLMAASVVIRFARVMLLEQPVARTMPGGRRSALVVGCGCSALLLLVGLFPSRLLNLAAAVRPPETRLNPDAPAGSSRGSATAASTRP